MKKILISALCIFHLSNLSAQSNSKDSLRNLLFHEQRDKARIKLLMELSSSFQNNSRDSSIIYMEQALQLSRKINFPIAEISSLYELSFDYSYSGNYSLALERVLAALKKSEELQDSLQIARSYFAIANVYDFQGDKELGLQYYLKSHSLFRNSKDTVYLGSTIVDIGSSYLSLNKLDSARIFTNEALELGLRTKNNQMIGGSYQNLGLINTRMKVYDLAKNYFHLAALSFGDSSNDSFMSDIEVQLAVAFDSTRQFDSAFYYARDSYHRAKLIDVPDRILPPAKELASLFKKTNLLDSALLYQDLVIELNDRLSSQEKQKQIQNITFR